MINREDGVIAKFFNAAEITKDFLGRVAPFVRNEAW